MKKLIPLLLCVPAILLAGCIPGEMAEQSPSFSLDVTSLAAGAEFEPGVSDSTRVIRVTSNRSWSVHLNDETGSLDESDPGQTLDWVRLSEEAHPNLPQSTQVTNLVVTFKRNFDQIPRSGVLHFYCDGEVFSVPVVQDAAVYHLNVSCDVDVASEDGETVPIVLDCNTEWRVKIDPVSTTADVLLPVNTGFDPAVVNLRIKENEDKSAKVVKLIFSAKDCPDQEVVITQPATTSDMKVFEVLTKLTVSGTGADLVPWVSLSEDLMDAEAVGKGIKYYYEHGWAGFDALAIPDENSKRFPAEGVSPLPSPISAKDCFYMVILGVCDGYRKSYTRVYVQNWKIDKDHIVCSGQGLSFSTEPPASNASYIRTDGAAISTVTDFKGSGSMYYKYHNASLRGAGHIRPRTRPRVRVQLRR